MIIKFFEPITGQTAFIGEGLLTQIHLHSTAYYPREFGGILIGLVKEHCYYVFDVQVPDKFESSTNGFTRHAESLNHYLKQLYEDSSSTLTYIGEWHSHPNANTKYSENDKKSMIEIAGDPLARITKPLLLIVALKQKSMLKSLYIVNQGKLLQFNQIETA